MIRALWLTLLLPLAGCPERTAEHLQISTPPTVEQAQLASRGRSKVCGWVHHAARPGRRAHPRA